MKTSTRLVIVISVVALAAVAFFAKQSKKPQPAEARPPATAAAEAAQPAVPEAAAPAAPARSLKIPRMVDLGADKCVPCKMMAPILAELKKEYAGRIDIEFIDVWKNEGAGEKYGIKLIPTQVFFDAAGKELYRHEGFLGRDDILAKFKELGMMKRE